MTHIMEALVDITCLVCLFLATAAAALCMNHHFEKEKNNELDDKRHGYAEELL